MQLFDAHLDLAYLAALGRDMLAPLDRTMRPHPPASVTLPALAEGGVRACLGTIFTEADGQAGDPNAYPAHDPDAAHAAGVRQLEIYHDWARAGHIDLFPPRSPNAEAPRAARQTGSAPLLLGILIECADPVRTPDELAWWVERGVVAIGLAWWKPSRYAGGNGTDLGLSPIGRDMVRAMDDLCVVHDASHLSQRALDELFERTDKPIIASHSNCRALLGGRDNEHWQRHLSDEAIAEIARRGGVIGLNLVRNFIRDGLKRNDPTDRPSIDEAIAHVEHICSIVGHRRAVGLGTDMDGGITADDLPRGIDTPSDLHKLCGGLAQHGWPDQNVHAFARGNWARFWNLD